MATKLHYARPNGPDRSTDERWRRMWSHREQLLRVARRRSMSAEDAEDAVHEAMVRAVETSNVDDDRLGAWLTTVTMRLCVDRHRQVSRETEGRGSSVLALPGPVPVEEAVCDRAEAQWLAGRSVELPARQAEALRLKSEDLDVGQVAHRMGLSYEAVESLLARARRTLRNSLAGTLSLAFVLLCARGRPRTGTGPAVVAASAAATLAVLGATVLPQLPDRERPLPPPSAMAHTESSAGASQAESLPPSPPLPGLGGPALNSPGAAGPLLLPEVPLAGLLPVLPELRLGTTADGVSPSVRRLMTQLSDGPGLPVLPQGVPELPELPDPPKLPDTSEVPGVGDVREAPDVPEAPAGGTPRLPSNGSGASPDSAPDPEDAAPVPSSGGTLPVGPDLSTQ